jgi:hypothetical protein
LPLERASECGASLEFPSPAELLDVFSFDNDVAMDG